MELMKSVDWSLAGFVSASIALDIYLYKHLTWRIAIYLPD